MNRQTLLLLFIFKAMRQDFDPAFVIAGIESLIIQAKTDFPQFLPHLENKLRRINQWVEVATRMGVIKSTEKPKDLDKHLSFKEWPNV